MFQTFNYGEVLKQLSIQPNLSLLCLVSQDTLYRIRYLGVSIYYRIQVYLEIIPSKLVKLFDQD